MKFTKHLNMKIRIFLLQIFLLLALGTTQAQKFGHINVGNILVLMPETKGADSLLQVYQDSLVAIGQSRADSLKSDIRAFSKAYQEGLLTPKQAESKQAELEKRHQEILAFEQQVQNLVAIKREELLTPILEKLQNAIDEVGKEGGYYMIFDTSVVNTILYAQESDDLAPLVKKKLGIE